MTTQSDTVKQARRAMLEFVLQNHPLDCPVCDAGGQCELQTQLSAMARETPG